MNTLPALVSLGRWSARRWLTAGLVAAGTILVIAIPTDLIDTPWFGREIPPTWWAWPSVLVTAVLAGLLVATYVAPLPGDTSATGPKPRRSGYVGGLLTYFAVGCPVCNKLVLIALGSSGALTWFEPFQPILQIVAVTLLAWALITRLRGEDACRVPTPIERSTGA